MNAIKITLAVIVIVAIVGYVIYSLVPSINPPGEIPLAQNECTNSIEQEIDSLKSLPDNKFCSKFYNTVKYHIDYCYKNSPISDSKLENDQWKENFSRSLYSVYAEKFIKQAFGVFRGSEWKNEDLDFIRSEYQELSNSPLLEKGSPVDKTFSEFQQIFNKYDEVVSFVSSCKAFSPVSSNLFDQYPVEDAAEKISQAEDYLHNELGNGYVNNCTYLHDNLKAIPRVLLDTHIKYLENKIEKEASLYDKYFSQRDYADRLHIPLKKEIDALRNSIYSGIPIIEKHYQLVQKLGEYDQKAYLYFNNKPAN